MVTGDDLAFVRLAMRRRLVSAQRIREAVERKKWDSKDRTIAEILVDMGALDPTMVKKIASEAGVIGRQTVSSGGNQRATVISGGGRKSDPSLEKSEPAAVAAADERTELESAPKHPRRVGRYEIVRLIGAGAMGAVYEARDRELDRTIALKLLAGEGAPSARAIARFRREAKLAARLDHPNIVRVYGAGFEDNHHFIAMDLVDGRSLAELVAIGEVTPRRAIHLARKIALAMQHAHERGVLHRDLKPANVLVDEKGEPRVTDFGLAVLAEPDESDRLTRTGAAVGTPAYMSPEQARGDLQDIDARSDVYALGATLFEMLTGGPPFEAPTFLELAKKICEAVPPSPRKKNAEVPEDLETICLKALEKEKNDRYTTAGDMAADLERLIDDAPIVAKPPSPAVQAKRWATRHPGFAATILALVLLNIAGGVRWYLQPGYLTVYSLPAGAKIYVDGAYIGTSVVNHPILGGRHEVKFALDNFDATPTRIDVDRGSNPPFVVRLIHEKGTLSLLSTPGIDGATVHIQNPHNGTVVATQLAPFDKLLEPGDYVVLVERPGYVSASPVQLKIEKGAVLELRMPPLAKESSALVLEVEPRGSLVRGNRGREPVTATSGSVVLEGDGTHDVNVSKIGYLTRSLTVRVPREKRRRVTLPPLRAASRPLGGSMVASPVAADLDGDGALDVLVLEKDDEGSWLTLLGGGEEAPRWRVRTDARAIAPLLADVDQDGVLDFALETPQGVVVREGSRGAPVLSLEVGPSVGDAPREGVVRSTYFKTRSRQNVRSMGIAVLRYGVAEKNLKVALWVDGEGFTERTISCPDLLAEEGSSPVAIPLYGDPTRPTFESMGGEPPVAYALFVALKGKLVRIDLSAGQPKDKFVKATAVDAKESTGASELATIPAGTKGTEALLLCPETGPLLALEPATGKVLARWGGPRAQLRDLRVIPLEKGWHGVLVRDASDANNAVTHLVRWNAIRGEFRDEGFKVERDEPLYLPPDEAWAPATRRRDEASVWTRGRTLDLRSNELAERTAETQVWARDGHHAVADLDGSGAAQVLASSPDGRSLVSLGPLSMLRWRVGGGPVIDSVAGDLDGEKALVVLRHDRVVALGASDGRTLWSKPSPAGARAVALVKTKRGRDVVVLGDKVVRRLKGTDGETVWEQAKAPPSRTIDGLGGDACGCGEEDVLLGDPFAVVAGKTGAVVKTVGAPPPQGAPPAGPVVLESERGRFAVVARVSTGGEAGTCELVRFNATPKEGVVEEWRIGINAATGPLAPLAPVVSGAPASLALVDAGNLTFLSPEKRPVGEGFAVGQVIAAKTPAAGDGLSPLVLVSNEGPQDFMVRSIVRSGEGGELAWARRLPAGRRTPSGPVFLDHGARVAILAPSGSIVILAAKDGAWLGERRAPEGELHSLVASYDLPEAGGATLVALTTDGELLAFDTATRAARASGDARLELRELARRVRLGGNFARQVVARLSQSSWENVATAQYVLAEACLVGDDYLSALKAVDSAIRLSGKHPAAQALRVKALVRQAKLERVDLDSEGGAELSKGILAEISALAGDRPELAAETAVEVAEEVASRLARRLVEFVVHATPTEPRARQLKVKLMLRTMEQKEKENSPKYTDDDRTRSVQWLREDALVALDSPRMTQDPELRALAAIAAFVVFDDTNFRFHARRVPEEVGEDLMRLERTLGIETADRYQKMFDALTTLGDKRKEWSALLNIAKRSVQKRQERKR